MKNYLQFSLRALFLSLAVLLSLPMLAVEVEIDGINYELVTKAKQATVISSGKYSGEIVIPESVKHEGTAYSVTIIGDFAFSGCSGLTSVTIPNSVTSIGQSAFDGCSGLTSVTIGNSVTSIESQAFSGCSGLTSVTIPNSVTSIVRYAFSGCSGLTSVTIPNSVKSIEYAAFSDCSSLTSVTIGNSVTHIGERAFYGCSRLTSVTIGNSVESIGMEAFDGCIGLTSATIGSGVIGDHAFSGCSDLTSVTIGNSVKSIGEYAFYDCRGLTSVTIGNSVKSIGKRAFVNCYRLTRVHISDIAAWCNIDFSDYDSNPLYYAHHLYMNGEEVKDLVIPNTVTSIKNYAFSDCTGLTSVTIPNTVTSIGQYAFDGCDGLTSVTIPNSVTSIGQYAFSGCSGLTSVTIGSGVEEIGYRAFANCPDLLDVYCYAEKVPSTYSSAFDGSYIEYVNLHVPNGSIESYKAKAPWSSFGKIVGLSGEEPEQPEVPEVEKCAAPVVTYVDGKLSLSCETEGAEFITNVAAEDAKKYYDAEIEFSATYNIEVYATKAGHENSDIVSVALVWIENGEVNDENAIINIEATPVLIQGNGGTLNISGVTNGTEITVYTVSGTEVARTVATESTTTINTGLQSGTIAIVKIGNKSVKIKI